MKFKKKTEWCLDGGDFNLCVIKSEASPNLDYQLHWFINIYAFPGSKLFDGVTHKNIYDKAQLIQQMNVTPSNALITTRIENGATSYGFSLTQTLFPHLINTSEEEAKPIFDIAINMFEQLKKFS